MKASEFRELAIEELDKKLNEFEEEMFNLNFKKANGPLDNPKRLTALRKNIAKVKTIIKEKQSEDK